MGLDAIDAAEISPRTQRKWPADVAGERGYGGDQLATYANLQARRWTPSGRRTLMTKRKPRQSATTVHQLVDCVNRRYRQHRSNIINEDIAFGDWLLAQKEKVRRTQGDLWGRVFKDRRIECSQATAERYMS